MQFFEGPFSLFDANEKGLRVVEAPFPQSSPGREARLYRGEGGGETVVKKSFLFFKKNIIGSISTISSSIRPI